MAQVANQTETFSMRAYIFCFCPCPPGLFSSLLFAFFISRYYEVYKALTGRAATVATSFSCVHATNDAFKIALHIV